MNQKSDIKGVVYCTFASLFALGAGVGCFAGLSEIINGDPKSNIVKTSAAGIFCVLMVGGVVKYLANRNSDNTDLEETSSKECFLFRDEKDEQQSTATKITDD